MNVQVISHKECWIDPSSPSGYATIGGFPIQIQTLSWLFDGIRLITTLRSTPLPDGARPITGHELEVTPLPEPPGSDFQRKLALLRWLPRHLRSFWCAIGEAEAVHALVPGDIGVLGILLALARRKPLFVRHCGTWGEPVTIADHFLLWLLRRIAGGQNVVMATGGGDTSPSATNTAITWVHSTSLAEAEIASLSPAPPWRRGEPLRLITVGRLDPGKNTVASVRALALIREHYPQATLDVVGGGPSLASLSQVAYELDVADAITFHGNVTHEEVLRQLQQGHLFLFPTRVKEGFPKAVLEGLACGLPVIATAVSVLPHLIGERNGRVLAAPTPEAVARAVLELIADEDRLAEMARSARKTSFDYTLEKWQAIIARRLEESWGVDLEAGVQVS